MSRLALLLVLISSSVVLAGGSAIERWANAVGGRDKIAAIKAIYREGTVEFAGQQGTIKVWHTADGKYRKEEKLGPFSSIEICDAVNVSLQQGDAVPRQLTGDELALEKSKAFANSNAIFFVFFPERHHGTRTEQDNTISFKPDGGVEWQVLLDPQTSLPKTMLHSEGGRTIAVTFDSYEVIDGLKFEKELHRSAGDRNRGAVIRFTKTVLNPPLDPLLFAVPTSSASNSTRDQVIPIVSQIQRADYEGDRRTLAKCYDALTPLLEQADSDLAVRIRYWRGFDLWRNAINGFNDKVDPAELERLLLLAVDEFKDALTKDPGFVDAKIGMISCLGFVAFIHRNERERVQDVIRQISPLVAEAKATAPDNPRLFWVLGPIIWHTPVEQGGGLEKTIENYERGLQVCSQIQPDNDPLQPSWGKPELLMSLAFTYLRKQPPDVNTAERHARAALELVPYCHYVRDVLLPQIAQAKSK